MRDGFIKVAVSTPDIRVADCLYNQKNLVKKAKEMAKKGVKILAFPELSLTGYTCSDLFLQETLLCGAQEVLRAYVEETSKLDMVSILGMPLAYDGGIYNVAVVVNRGEIKGIVPKTYIPNYGEFYEARQFRSGGEREKEQYRLPWCEDVTVPFGTKLLFRCQNMINLVFAIEICEDLWAPIPPSCKAATQGANVIVNLSASDELTGKSQYRRELVKNQSARTLTAYLYADAGEGESTTDVVFAGHNMIVENGQVLAECRPFAKEKDLITEIDLNKLQGERRRTSTFPLKETSKNTYEEIVFKLETDEETELTRCVEKMPFVPSDSACREERCEEIFDIQSYGLLKRLRHTGCRNAVVGLSGGLDSTLALLVTVRAFEKLGLDKKGIICVTMPCFGTTSRTYENAVNLAKQLGTALREIPIRDAVLQHFSDIGQDADNHDVTYENSQARERTQVLMDVANQINGMVIGTGDMSELALGWATYNGDHMSMYGVNASVPKTLVRYLVQFYADASSKEELKNVLYDVLDTPVSPELLPPEEGKISQKTEDIVGPYELHDFFLYYFLRFGFSPKKIFRLAVYAFADEYDKKTIYKWLSVFCHRFFRQQFKRSCLPDGPKVGTVSVSPRGDLRMPSDAMDSLWKAELDSINQSLV